MESPGQTVLVISSYHYHYYFFQIYPVFLFGMPGLGFGLQYYSFISSANGGGGARGDWKAGLWRKAFAPSHLLSFLLSVLRPQQLVLVAKTGFNFQFFYNRRRFVPEIQASASSSEVCDSFTLDSSPELRYQQLVALSQRAGSLLCRPLLQALSFNSSDLIAWFSLPIEVVAVSCMPQ